MSVPGNTLTCYTNSCCALKETSDLFSGINNSSGSIYLTHKTITQCRNLLPHSRKMKFCLLIDANASEFSALQCHEMKIGQPGARINSELCHAISVCGSYLSQQRCRPHRVLLLPKVSLEQKVCFCYDPWRVKCRHQLNKEKQKEHLLKAAHSNRAEGLKLKSLPHRHFR